MRVAALQERAARATPAAVQEVRDGDWLRHTDSPTTWWAGAALLHGDAPDVPARVERAERFYAGRGAPARFQVCPACPPDLDDVLAARGYRRSGEVHLLTARTADLPAHPVAVVLSERPSRAWVDLLVRAQDGDGDHAAELRLVERVALRSAYATAHLDGRPVAVGRAVADDGWAGVFGMATLPEARVRGAGGAVLAALAGWAADLACDGVYLQVLADSAAAVALYRRAGFTQVCRYHYRTAAGCTSAATSTVR